jgi:hypothetical protein
VHERWKFLASSSLASVVGISWLLLREGAPASAWASIEMIGMALCAGIGLFAFGRRYPKKWPAAVALVGAAPMAQNVLLNFPLSMELVIHFGAAYLMFIAGSVAAVVAAVLILASRPPPPPADHEVVARARVVR